MAPERHRCDRGRKAAAAYDGANGNLADRISRYCRQDRKGRALSAERQRRQLRPPEVPDSLQS